MENLLLMAVCFIAGLFLQRIKSCPRNLHTSLNFFIIYVALPAITLRVVRKIQIDSTLIYPMTAAWLLFFLGVLFIWMFSKIFSYSDRTKGCLILTAGLGNTSFVGFPLIQAFYGSEWISVGIIVDQIGTFMVLSTVGIFYAMKFSGGELNKQQLFKKILSFPPFLSLIAAILLIPVSFPVWAENILFKIGETLVPLALISVGFQLRFGNFKGNLGKLFAGLTYKLVLGPLLIMIIFILILGARSMAVKIAVFETAMAPMITGGIIAMENDLDAPLASAMLSVGIPLSFGTAALWYLILQKV